MDHEVRWQGRTCIAPRPESEQISDYYPRQTWKLTYTCGGRLYPGPLPIIPIEFDWG